MDTLRNEVILLTKELHVKEMLQVYNTTIKTLGAAKDAKYFIIQFDPESFVITVGQYKAKQSAEANQLYTYLESQIPSESSKQIVLVSVDNITALKRAYPNYFLDTNLFSRLVDRVLKGEIPPPLPPRTIPDAD